MRSLADEIPFDIPDSWEWVRISSIAALVTKGTTPRGGNVVYSDKGIGFLRAENVAGLDRLDLSKLNHIDEATHTGFLKRSILEADDVLITIAGTLGRTAIVKEENLPLNANQAVAIIRLVDSHSVDLKYLVYALNAPAIQDKLTAQKKITAIPNLTLEIISDCLVPIPPLNEQRRIVNQFALFVPQISEYKYKQTELSALNTAFPESLKKSILQEAVQGKLVPQDPSDEPAEALLERIRAEKQLLIKEGKIKKDKHESVIFRRDNSHYEKRGADIVCIDDIIPFELPDSWEWVHLEALITSTDAGKSPQCDSRPRRDNEWGVIKTTAIQDGYFVSVENKVLPHDFVVNKSIIVHRGDLLITRAGPRNRTGVVCIVGEEPKNLILSDKTVRLSYVRGFVNPHYIMIALNSPAVQTFVVDSMSGMAASQVNIAQEKMKTFLIPLPPLNEQQRIVDAIASLYRPIERLTF